MTALTLLVINFLVFHTCWLATAFGAAHDLMWLGPTFVIPSLALHLFLIKDWTAEARNVLLIAVIGYTVDALQFRAGILEFHSDQVAMGLPPIWLLFQWMIFATLFRLTLNWLHGRYYVAALLGGIGGPLSYLAAVQLNAMGIGVSSLQALACLAVVWAILTPLFVWMAHRGRDSRALHKRYSEQTV